jgi:hypothetical protein
MLGLHSAGSRPGGDPVTNPTQPSDPVLQHRMEQVERAIVQLTDMTRQLVRLEERHIETRNALERAFTAIDKQGQRLASIEQAMPKVNLATGWVFVAVAAVVGAAFMVIWRSATMPQQPKPATPVPAAIVAPAVVARSSSIVQ